MPWNQKPHHNCCVLGLLRRSTNMIMAGAMFGDFQKLPSESTGLSKMDFLNFFSHASGLAILV